MTQTLNPVTAIPSTTAPVTTLDLMLAAEGWRDIRTAEGQLVYPGSKLSFLIESKGIDSALHYINAQARKIAGARPLYQVSDVRSAIVDLNRMAQAGEYATATQIERDIWEGVLEAVATGNAQAGYLAAEALATKQMGFPRVASA